MKALVCLECSTIRSPHTDGTWTLCDCQHAAIRWEDPRAGHIVVWAMNHDKVRILGVMNSVLTCRAQTNEEWRIVHDGATKSAEGYIFHTSNRNCWAALFRPGETSDSRWATREEWNDVRKELALMDGIDNMMTEMVVLLRDWPTDHPLHERAMDTYRRWCDIADKE